MSIIVDASVAVKWFFPETGRAEARKLLEVGGPLSAPDLVIPESCSVAWKKRRLGQITDEQVVDLAARLRQFIEDIVPTELLAPRAVEIALALDHPVYDAFQLALAELRSAPMVTVDQRLLSRVSGTPWERLVQPLA